MKGWWGESYRHYLASKMRRYAPSTYSGRQWREVLAGLPKSGGYKRVASKTVRVGRLEVDKGLYEDDSNFKKLVEEKAVAQEVGGERLSEANRELGRYLSKNYRYEHPRMLFPTVLKGKRVVEKAVPVRKRAKVRKAEVREEKVRDAQLDALLRKLQAAEQKEKERKARWYREKKAKVRQKKLKEYVKGPEWIDLGKKETKTFTFELMPAEEEEK